MLERGAELAPFEREQDGSWIQVVELKASDATPGDIFGESVSIWEDRAVVGAMRVNYCDDCTDPPGAAYFFSCSVSTRARSEAV